LRKLDEADVKRVVGKHLNSPEIKALMKRRDRIVAHFEQMVAQKGEDAVLY
jgi:hypothetical protein